MVRNPLFFQSPKMSSFLYENHQCSPTLTLLNVPGVLGVLNVLNVLDVPMDASLACWALFCTVGREYREDIHPTFCPSGWPYLNSR